jgi:hypothetical protein
VERGSGMKELDLLPHEYRRDGEVPRPSPDEPFWRPGAPEAIGYFIGFALMFVLLHALR